MESSKFVGQARVTDKVSMIVDKDDVTFSTWLKRRKKKFDGRIVEVTLKIIEKKFTLGDVVRKSRRRGGN